MGGVMGKKQAVRIVAVVEDRTLERFVWHTLKAFGFRAGKVDIRSDYPKRGTGSGKQYVDNKYQREAATFRRKSRENIALIIATEADEQTVDYRVQVLDALLAGTNQAPRAVNEHIVYWIPKRHVETWGLHLTGNAVDEDTDYHNRSNDIDWGKAGSGFRKAYSDYGNGKRSALPSLNRAYEETQRLNL
jgi:hypothetical protein